MILVPARSVSRGLVGQLTLLVLLVIAAKAGAAEPAKPKDPPKSDVPGVVTALSTKHDHEYAWYVPKAFAKTKNLPLVVSYHSGGGSGLEEIKAWTPLADKFGLVVICPTSELAGARRKPGTKGSIEEFIEETEAVMSMLDKVKESVSIDHRRAMVTGKAGGGNPTFWLGLLHSDLFPYMCTRCANFPKIVQRLSDSNPAYGAQVKLAAEKGHSYVFWAEKDHPIILGELPGMLAFMESLKPTDFKQEKVLGLGQHDPTAQRAMDWFAASLKAQAKAAAPDKPKSGK